MSLLHPSSVGAPVALWFSNGVPVRLVHGGTRYRVVGEPQPVADGWTVEARDGLGHSSWFTVGPSDSGWTLRGVR
jgi:hypothetical protein